jgi:hypothetical protein
MAYQSKDDILRIVRSFEDATVSRSDWRHAEHVTVAFYYAFHHDYETALGKMRNGIFNLLESFEIDLSKEMPYHETLTVFWMRTIFGLIENRCEDLFVETANKVLEACGDKDLPLKFYSRSFLFSDEARQNFVEGDLQ